MDFIFDVRIVYKTNITLKIFILFSWILKDSYYFLTSLNIYLFSTSYSIFFIFHYKFYQVKWRRVSQQPLGRISPTVSIISII